MKLFRMIRFGIRDAFKSVGRNFSLSIASISCISITLLVVSLALIASFNVKSFSKDIKSDVTMVVFLNLGVTQDEVASFEKNLNNISNVSSDWESKDPTERKEMLAADGEFWSSVAESIDNEAEIFHYSYLVKVKDITKMKETVSEIENMPVVDYVNYGETMVEKLITMFDIVEKIAFVIVIVLVIVTVFLIVNTIKLTIFSRKREISIMRVVGASNWTIKNPFVIEGFLIGLLGSLFPIIVTIYGYAAFYNSLDNGQLFSSLIKLIDPYPFVYIISLILAAIGVLVGMFGSGRAVRKYLKV
ncbi:MAG: permease-like cell division protein FtsX [Bacilli bacterium]|nr:permease-like cell division protein FtsX [Bacilli bacterium]